jgi:glycosyltransferase involved in cell wall biosynthesis
MHCRHVDAGDAATPINSIVGAGGRAVTPLTFQPVQSLGRVNNQAALGSVNMNDTFPPELTTKSGAYGTPLKVWVQCFNYYPHDLGGAERSARELAVGLRDKGCDVEVILSEDRVAYPTQVDGIKVTIVAGLQIGKSPVLGKRHFYQRALWNLRSEIDPTLFVKLRRKLQQDRPDVVVFNNLAGHGSAFMAACRAEKVPALAIVRDYGWFCAFGTMTRRGKLCSGMCGTCQVFSTFRRRLMRSAKIVAISPYVADRVKTILPGVDVTVVENSIPDSFFVSPPQRQYFACKPLVFGMIGRLHSSKGIDNLLHGWQLSRLAAEGHSLKLAGDLIDVQLPDHLESLGISYLGRQEAIPFLDSLDVMILPATWPEPFGRTVIEALSRNVFVIGSACGAIPYLIPEERGLILPDTSSETIAAALRQTAKSWETLGAASRNIGLEHVNYYRAERMLNAYHSILHSIVRKS